MCKPRSAGFGPLQRLLQRLLQRPSSLALSPGAPVAGAPVGRHAGRSAISRQRDGEPPLGRRGWDSWFSQVPPATAASEASLWAPGWPWPSRRAVLAGSPRRGDQRASFPAGTWPPARAVSPPPTYHVAPGTRDRAARPRPPNQVSAQGHLLTAVLTVLRSPPPPSERP